MTFMLCVYMLSKYMSQVPSPQKVYVKKPKKDFLGLQCLQLQSLTKCPKNALSNVI